MIFIVTATVNVFLDVHPDHSSSVSRRNEYIGNLMVLSSSLLRSSLSNSKIFFVENSSDLVHNFNLYPNLSNVEYVNSDRMMNSSKGKGACEIEMINNVLHGLNSSCLFVKITGRYSISNLNDILTTFPSINNSLEILGTEEINVISKQFSSRFFFSSIPFWTSTYSQAMLSKVDDNVGYFIEHALYDLSLISKKVILDVLPSRTATSATTAYNLRLNPFKRLLKRIVFFFVKP